MEYENLIKKHYADKWREEDYSVLLEKIKAKPPIFDPPMPRKMTQTTPSLTKPITKQQFFDRLIKCGPNGEHRRFVMKRDLEVADKIIAETRGTEQYGIVVEREPETHTKLFVPESPDDDYNLVTSLCTDGLHRPVYDLDFTKDQLTFKLNPSRLGRSRAYITHNGNRVEVAFPEGETILFDSTHHCHAYVQGGVMFDQYLESLLQIPGDDARKYATNVRLRGLGCLRPPWIKKEEQ